MLCQAAFDQWLTTIMQHLSPLSKPQTTGLALWSFGMVLARSCALSAVSNLLAEGMQRHPCRRSTGAQRPWQRGQRMRWRGRPGGALPLDSHTPRPYHRGRLQAPEA